VHPDGRRAYIGEEADRTRNGEKIMSHNKAFKSLPIRSWTGGAKVRLEVPLVPRSHLFAEGLEASQSNQGPTRLIVGWGNV
jgi:hypothetical protein